MCCLNCILVFTLVLLRLLPIGLPPLLHALSMILYTFSHHGRGLKVSRYREIYFRALRSLVVLSFPQLLSFSLVLSKPLSETVTSAGTAGCPTVEHL
jgi:hypothetical protein